jgi:voltage-gated potassium channel
MQSSAIPNRIGAFQLALLLLSVVGLGTLLLDATVSLPPEASEIIQGLDTLVCILFFIDFLTRFYVAERKLQFMKWGWIDLVACIPNVDLLRLGRLVRIIRVIRVLRAIRSFQRVIAMLMRNRTRNGIASVSCTFFLLIVFASIAILLCESGPNSNITTAEDAVWWSATTITTVGYGDKYPITTEGRIIAMVLMFSGVGLFGTLSGLIAGYFFGTGDSDETSEKILRELRELRAKVDMLEVPRGEEISKQPIHQNTE